jgi:hypothetical protein
VTHKRQLRTSNIRESPGIEYRRSLTRQLTFLSFLPATILHPTTTSRQLARKITMEGKYSDSLIHIYDQQLILSLQKQLPPRCQPVLISSPYLPNSISRSSNTSILSPQHASASLARNSTRYTDNFMGRLVCRQQFRSLREIITLGDSLGLARC